MHFCNRVLCVPVVPHQRNQLKAVGGLDRPRVDQMLPTARLRLGPSPKYLRQPFSHHVVLQAGAKVKMNEASLVRGGAIVLYKHEILYRSKEAKKRN
jgi:hypothetical protein